jgi:hypothetical protein
MNTIALSLPRLLVMMTTAALGYRTNESSYKWGYSVGNYGLADLGITCDKSAILNVGMGDLWLKFDAQVTLG